MVVTFDQSVMGVSEGEHEHPRWNCATPSTDVLLHTDRIEPSFAACATGGTDGNRTRVQNYYSHTIFLRNSQHLEFLKGIHAANTANPGT